MWVQVPPTAPDKKQELNAKGGQLFFVSVLSDFHREAAEAGLESRFP